MERFKDPRHAIARRIREMRNRRGITQLELAHKLGVSYQLVQRYERGEKLTLDRVINIASALHVEVDSLLNTESSFPGLY